MLPSNQCHNDKYGLSTEIIAGWQHTQKRLDRTSPWTTSSELSKIARFRGCSNSHRQSTLRYLRYQRENSRRRQRTLQSLGYQREHFRRRIHLKNLWLMSPIQCFRQHQRSTNWLRTLHSLETISKNQSRLGTVRENQSRLGAIRRSRMIGSTVRH